MIDSCIDALDRRASHPTIPQLTRHPGDARLGEGGSPATPAAAPRQGPPVGRTREAAHPDRLAARCPGGVADDGHLVPGLEGIGAVTGLGVSRRERAEIRSCRFGTRHVAPLSLSLREALGEIVGDDRRRRHCANDVEQVRIRLQHEISEVERAENPRQAALIDDAAKLVVERPLF